MGSKYMSHLLLVSHFVLFPLAICSIGFGENKNDESKDYGWQTNVSELVGLSDKGLSH